WDLITGKEIHRASLLPQAPFSPLPQGEGVGVRASPPHAPVTDLAFGPSGNFLATAAEGEPIGLWETTSGKSIGQLGKAAHLVAFSPDGKTAAVCQEESTALWNIKTRQKFREFKGHEDRILSVAYSPDGRTIASAAEDETYRIWDVSTGK